MAHYRCYLLAVGGRLRAGEGIESDSDAGAIARAIQIFGQRTKYDGLEVWKARERIHAEARQPTEHVWQVHRRVNLIDDRGLIPRTHTGRLGSGHTLPEAENPSPSQPVEEPPARPKS
jgi:hypothetical protein